MPAIGVGTSPAGYCSPSCNRYMHIVVVVVIIIIIIITTPPPPHHHHHQRPPPPPPSVHCSMATMGTSRRCVLTRCVFNTPNPFYCIGGALRRSAHSVGFQWLQTPSSSHLVWSSSSLSFDFRFLESLHELYSSHVKSHTSHVTRHTSHVTHHTSHVTRYTSPQSQANS